MYLVHVQIYNSILGGAWFWALLAFLAPHAVPQPQNLSQVTPNQKDRNSQRMAAPNKSQRSQEGQDTLLAVSRTHFVVAVHEKTINHRPASYFFFGPKLS